MTPRNKIDKVLELLVQANQPPFRTDGEIQNELTFNIEFKELFEILLKLEKDGNIYREIDKSSEIAKHYSTFEGRFFFNRGGYKGAQRQFMRNKIWTVAKTIAVFINALFIILIGVRSCEVSNRSNQLEIKISKQNNSIDSLKNLANSQSSRIDSLINHKVNTRH